jgi:DNA-binding SARP family transcriptional activator
MTLALSYPSRIQICGSLAVERGGRRIEGDLPGRQGRLLFTYLVVNRHRQAPRDEVAEALWREPDPAAVETRLNPLLSKLRRIASSWPFLSPVATSSQERTPRGSTISVTS